MNWGSLGNFHAESSADKEEGRYPPRDSGKEHICEALLEPIHNGNQRQSVQGPRTAGAQTGLRELANLLTLEGKYLEGHTDN